MDHFKVNAMKAYVNIGANHEFKLSEALLGPVHTNVTILG